MNLPDFTFSSDPTNRFPIVDESGQSIQASLDLANGLLMITPPRRDAIPFPLVLNGEPNPQAAFITQAAGCTPMLEIGEVGFLDQPEFLEDYPINEPIVKGEWNFNLAGGGIGILDIRNLGRIVTRFHLEMVPVQLSITGIFLRAATIMYSEDSGFKPWYEQFKVAAK